MKSTGKKLIVIKPNGNHSNRLFQNLHFEVFCMKYNIEYINPTFGDLADYYINPCNSRTNLFYNFLQLNMLGDLFRHSRVVKKIFSVVWLLSKCGCLKLVRFDKEEEMQESEKILLKAFEKTSLVYVAGWWFRIPELITQYRDEMRLKYVLNPSLYHNNIFVDRIVELKSQGHTIDWSPHSKG